jgi:hypothetical protein
MHSTKISINFIAISYLSSPKNSKHITILDKMTKQQLPKLSTSQEPTIPEPSRKFDVTTYSFAQKLV